MENYRINSRNFFIAPQKFQNKQSKKIITGYHRRICLVDNSLTDLDKTPMFEKVREITAAGIRNH